jgi:hypothetical protein
MKLLRWLALVVLVLAVFFVVRRTATGPGMSPAELLAARAECGHEMGDSANIAEINQIKDVPEFHDCQRFIVMDGGAPKYDALAAIFAAQTLPELEKRLGPPLVPRMVPVGAPPGTNIAAPSAVLRPSFDTFIAGLMAVVYANAPYTPLGITTGRNCLYVWHYLTPGPTPTEVWTARMVPKPGATSCPDATVGALAPGTELKVKRTQVAGFTDLSDYPPVARWDWDGTNHLQYVGIACGAAWCEVYKDVLEPSPSLPAPADLPREVRRVRLIKGWYDQQFLATTDAGGKLVPSSVMGTIMPDPALGEFDDAKFSASSYVQVAEVVLSSIIKNDQVLKRYEKKFNFNKSTFDHPGTISLQGDVTTNNWKAKVKQRKLFMDVNKGRNVIRRTAMLPTGYKVPGVARWRWMKTDEGTWIRCSVGCCEMSDDTDVPT